MQTPPGTEEIQVPITKIQAHALLTRIERANALQTEILEFAQVIASGQGKEFPMAQVLGITEDHKALRLLVPAIPQAATDGQNTPTPAP